LIPLKANPNLPQLSEVPIGDVIQAAITQGFHVQAEVFADGTYLDIGTPNDLVRAVQQLSHEVF
ncbi:dTDP-glucose pyrophosphorylase, partial [Fischerella thermalis WC217]